MTSQEKFTAKINKGFHICVGLDTDINKIPEHLKNADNPVLEFNKRIIDATKDYACAYKVNLAFYEKDGLEGMKNLEETVAYLPDDSLSIGDAKRGDIGNTSKMYAESLFNHFNFDASTLNPYMGIDSVQPFLDHADKINFILALTSNPSAVEIEKIKTEDGKYVFQKVIAKVAEWNKSNNCGLVFGATNLGELQENIESFQGMPVLLPGVGAQGGDMESVVKTFKEAGHRNFVINISRGLLYADKTEDFANVTRELLMQHNETINNIMDK